MNAVATALLDASLDVQLTDPRVRARERLHLLGVLVEVDAASGTIPSSRAEAIAAFALLDVDAVDLIDEGRG